MKRNATGELLALGKIARVDSFACGHVVLTVEQLRIGFTRADFLEFAQTIQLAAAHLEKNDAMRAEWGFYL